MGLRRFGGHRKRETYKGKAIMKTPVIPSKQTRTKFDKAFKQHAVELWLRSGKTVTEAAADLGIDAQRLCAWRKRHAEQLEVENARLRRENEYLRQQRDILKKTLGILSEPPSNGLNGLTR
jgi:transposase